MKRKGDGDSSEDERAYKDLIACSDDDESEQSDDSEDSEKAKVEQTRIEDIRKKLLSGLTQDNDRGQSKVKNTGSDEEELEVNFGIGFGEDIGEKLLKKKEEKREKNQMNDF